MTIDDEGKQLRAEISKLRSGNRRRYDVALRQRILEWIGRAAAAGLDEPSCSRQLGVKAWRFKLWREYVVKPAEVAPKAMTRIEVDEVTGAGTGGIALVAPSGYRVEGLALGQVATLLRELA